MKVTPRTSASGRRRPEPDVSHRSFDILGVLLLALALIALLSLLLADTGILGGAMSGLLRTLFGNGAWVVPVVLTLLGLGVIGGKRSVEVTHLTWGLLLLFVAAMGAFSRSVGGDYFDPEAVQSSGGYVGAVVGWAVDRLLGSARLVGLGAIGMVGLILSVNLPLKAVAAALRDRTRELRSNGSPRLDRPTRKAVVAMKEEEESEPVDNQPRRTRQAPIFRDTAQAQLAPSEPQEPKEGYRL
ncbi:MAG TPA: DNA translocase FtsK 4TM domain-containing protein, partial [Fimbriimonadaceae bacterium]|nr:DNA translocase FtsK 4TM domain-containing protein [Fimbriimonadaceae bacterium]